MGENNIEAHATEHAPSSDLKTQLATSEGEHVEQIGHAAQAQESQEGVFESIRKHPWSFIWCVYAIYTLMLSSFDNQAAGTVLGIPRFRQDFGSSYNGDYVLPAKWQSAYSGAPVAS